MSIQVMKIVRFFRSIIISCRHSRSHKQMQNEQLTDEHNDFYEKELLIHIDFKLTVIERMDLFREKYFLSIGSFSN